MSKKVMSLPCLNVQTFTQNRDAFVEQFAQACSTAQRRQRGGQGFFLLRHDIPRRVVRTALHETRSFFETRDDADKDTISYHHCPALRGYMRLGAENTGGATDWREQVEFAVEYPQRPKAAAAVDTDHHNHHDDSDKHGDDDDDEVLYHRLRARRNPWPDTVQPTLEPAIVTYVTHLNRLADVLRQTFCLALGLPATAMNDVFDRDDANHHPAHWALKLCSYPSQPQQQQQSNPSELFGVGEHVDSNFLTLILQDNSGLQVWMDGEWTDVPLRPDDDDEAKDDEYAYLIVNLGEQAQVLSNGAFVATPHRVVPPTATRSRRTSLAFFAQPSLDTVIAPLTTTSSTTTTASRSSSPASSAAWTWEKRPQNRILGTVGDNTFKSLARSHPVVFEKHHPDLQVLPDGSLKKKIQ